MAVVYKYRVIGQTQLQLPADVKIIYFAYQHGELFLWALIPNFHTSTPELHPRKFMVVATGEEFEDAGKQHLFSVITPGGLVWHLLEVLD